MGKGNRSRIERALNESASAGKKVQAKKNKVSGAGIFVSIAAILVVVALLIGAIGVLNDSGWLARTKTVTETENFKVDGSMMNYFYTTQFNNYYQYYSQLYSQLASSGMDVSSYVYSAMGIKDPSKSLKNQEYAGSDEEGKGKTVFNYYMGKTEDYVTRMLTYCEWAVKKGIELEPKDYEDIDHTIEDLKDSYQSFYRIYYNTFSAFLAANYGTGVKEQDIRKCMELTTLAAKFEEQLTDEEKLKITGDKSNTAVEEFVKDNPSKFLMADYYSYAFSVSNKGKTDAEFEAEKAEILEKAKKLAEATDKEAYKAAVIDLLIEAEKESYREKNWDKYLEENGNNDDKAKEALEKYYEKTYTDAYKETKFKATLTEGYKHPDITLPQYDPENKTSYNEALDELRKWVFGVDASDCEKGECDHEEGEEHYKNIVAAKPGDITYIDSTTKKEETVKKEETTSTGATTEEPTTEEPTTDGAAPASEETTKEETTTKAPTNTPTEKVEVTTYTVTVYLLEKATYRNTEITKHFGYAMFKTKEDAEKFYAEYSKLGKENMNKDTLIETVEKLHEEMTPFAYDGAEDYMPGDLEDQKVTGADKWLETAKPGDCSGVIELTYTTTKKVDGKDKEEKTPYYSILVYDKDGFDAWYCDALEGATGVAVSDWYEENALTVNFNAKAYKYISV